MPQRVKLAVVISFLCHGVFILAGHYRSSYDAYTHMLFANHYAENWFSLWEPRWYTGFTVVSYPPLAHQLIALFIPVLGFDKAYALILWLVATVYPLGVYAFSRIFVGKSAASYAALASALLMPIYVTAHVFGQLPFFTSTLLALFGAASFANYLRSGKLFDLVLAVSLVMTTMASHHATLLVQPFFVIAVVASQIEKINWRTIFLRTVIFGFIAIPAAVFVIWPFWDWGRTQVMQTPIDHLSRHNFFTDPFAFLIFFIPLYGPLMAIIPFVFWKWPRRFWGLIFSFSLLLLLGLGGTTPLPALFFGKNWAWLTYDRFAFWASITLTPFFGALYIRWKRRFATQGMAGFSSRKLFPTLTVSVFALTTFLVWMQPYWLPTQPQPVAMQPIIDFLNQADHSQWRYVTFGFGNQYTLLNLRTHATTIDGSYHTVRTLPELRDSGVAEIDTSYWVVNGLQALVPILQMSGEHGVRWGFVNPGTVETIKLPEGTIRRSPFIPVLDRLGWIKVSTLTNGVMVYENPKAVLPPPANIPYASPVKSFSWGVLPLLSLVTTLTLGGLKAFPIQAERAIRSIYAFAIGLIPFSFCFWIYQPIAEFPQPRVYLTYTDALFFFSDALALLAVILWLSTKLAQSSISRNIPTQALQPLRIKQFIIHRSVFSIFLFALFLLASFSILWSAARHTSTYIAIHLWLIFLLILSLRDWHAAWKFALYGFCAALTIEIITGFSGFALQSTGFLNTLNMKWPGQLDPSIHGAIVVQLANGLRILRAYGTLPHPNILGGFTLVTLLGPVGLFLTSQKINYAALILYSLGLMLLGLTFSRSAWLGLIAFFSLLLLKSKYLENKRLWLLISVTVLTTLLTVYPLRQFVFARVSDSSVMTEQFSIRGRLWLDQQALDILRAHPLTGVGVGNFIIELAAHAVENAPIEPVHNIFLLVGSELGIIGVLLLMALLVSMAVQIFKAQSPKAILASATVTGLGVISLLDHYLWTLAPGRILLGLSLGLWIGQVTHGS